LTIQASITRGGRRALGSSIALAALLTSFAARPAFAQAYYYPQDQDVFGAQQRPAPFSSGFFFGSRPQPQGGPAVPYFPNAAPRTPTQTRIRRAPPKSSRSIARVMSRDTGAPQGGPPDFSPDTAALTATAAAKYAKIAASGGWPTNVGAVGPGSNGAAVVLLRSRLALEGYLSTTAAPPDPQAFDSDVEAAVKKFQANVGLPQTGAARGETLDALNVPAAARVAQLTSTAARLAQTKFPFGNLYVDVNLPAETVEAVENGEPAHRYIAIVGDLKHPSPEVVSNIRAVDINPTWTLPTSIIKNEIIPKLARDPDYLAREHIRVLDHGREVDPMYVDWRSSRALGYTLRQDAGPFNALGFLRLDMPNDQAVYMHDTDARALFEKSNRFLSHGCVRVKGVSALATLLLRETGDRTWTEKAIDGAVGSGETRVINLPHTVPVVWVYMTGWADRDGAVHFRKDVYRLDKPPEAMAHAELP
jgi:murein L,D-transpeptidase YcbB/YkuD